MRGCGVSRSLTQSGERYRDPRPAVAGAMAAASAGRDWGPYLPPEVAPEALAAVAGLVSDTHLPERLDALPPALFQVLAGVDVVLHAGDIGELRVLDELSRVAPAVAVHGNDDTPEAQRELPYQQVLTLAGQRIVLSHTHYPDLEQEMASRREDAWGPKLSRRAGFGHRAGAGIVVWGHTHIPLAVLARGGLPGQPRRPGLRELRHPPDAAHGGPALPAPGRAALRHPRRPGPSRGAVPPPGRPAGRVPGGPRRGQRVDPRPGDGDPLGDASGSGRGPSTRRRGRPWWRPSCAPRGPAGGGSGSA